MLFVVTGRSSIDGKLRRFRLLGITLGIRAGGLLVRLIHIGSVTKGQSGNRQTSSRRHHFGDERHAQHCSVSSIGISSRQADVACADGQMAYTCKTGIRREPTRRCW